MALRVLLADESSTIKKVMQLALQDFGVEVKAVAVGLDVLEVARSFQPDVIFADVLLSKKNGYEVCAELKSDIKLHKTPVVLMWSGFMEIDEKKVALAGPDARLEKPFDADILRNLVKTLIPRLQKNVISQYLRFPHLPEIQEDQVVARPATQTAVSPTATPQSPSLVDTDPDELEEFQNVPLPKIKEKTIGTTSSATGKPDKTDKQEDWATKDLSKWRIEIPAEDDLALAPPMEIEPIAAAPFEMELEPSGGGVDLTSSKPQPRARPQQSPTQMVQLSHERVEQILREEVKATLESIAWKIIPDLAERIVREEIQKLMKDAESL